MRVPRCECLISTVCVMLALTAYGCNNQPSTPPSDLTPTPVAALDTQTVVARGEYLVTAGGCHDCHSPKKYGPKGPEPDPTRLLSGHREDIKIATFFTAAAGSPWTVATTDDFTAWSGPWGISFAANLTPDTNTGLRSGVWTEELFIQALRTGKHMGTSRDILPPMPWPNYANLNDDDLKAIWTYLGTIPAVTNHVPDPVPPGTANTTR